MFSIFSYMENDNKIAHFGFFTYSLHLQRKRIPCFKIEAWKWYYGQTRNPFYVISIEFLSPQKCKDDWFFVLKISQVLDFYGLKFVKLENCGAHFYHTKYMETHQKSHIQMYFKSLLSVVMQILLIEWLVFIVVPL